MNKQQYNVSGGNYNMFKGSVSGDNYRLMLTLCRKYIKITVDKMNEYHEYPSDAEFEIAMMGYIGDIRNITDAYTELFNSLENK